MMDTKIEKENGGGCRERRMRKRRKHKMRNRPIKG